MIASRPPSLYSKVLAFVSASTLASCLVVSWIAIESQHSDLRARLAEQYPQELAQQESLLLRHLGTAGWTLSEALPRTPLRLRSRPPSISRATVAC